MTNIQAQRGYIIIPITIFAVLFITGQIFNHLPSEVILIGIQILVFTIVTVAAIKLLPFKKWNTIKILLLSLVIIDMAVRIFEGFANSYFSLPRLFGEILAIAFAPLLLSCRIYKIAWASTMSAYLILFQEVLFMPLNHIQNFGTLSNTQSAPLPAKIELIQGDQMLTSDSFENRVILLDFWFKGCPVCFKKMPKFKDAYDLYAQNSKIKVLSIGVLMSNDTREDLQKILTEKGYTFGFYSCTKALADSFKIIAYPTCLIIRNSRIVFRGDIEDAKKEIEKIAAKL